MASEIINSEVKKHPESCAQSGIELPPSVRPYIILSDRGGLYYVKRETETYPQLFTLCTVSR